MLSEAIRASIETKLNDNVAGKTFIVGSYAVLDDSEQDFIFNYKNGYTLISENYMAAMMIFNAEYKAMPSQITGTANIDIKFLVLAEDQATTETDIATLNEFVSKIVGVYESLTDGTKTYNTVWNMTALMPIGELILVNGKRYLQIQTTVYVSFSDTVYYGNQYQYYLNNVRIYPFVAQGNRDNEEFYPHILGDYEAKGDNATSAWVGSYTFYNNAYLSSIVDTFMSDTYDMKITHKLKEITPTLSAGNEIAVRIKSASYSTDLGEEVAVSLTLFKSDSAYVETIYSITYTLNGGTNNGANPATFIEPDLPITLLPATKADYTFRGWYATAGFIGPIITTISTIGNKTYYAKFTYGIEE